MKIKYYVKQLTDEGRLVDPEDSGPYYNRTNPFAIYSGYETEEEAERAIRSCFSKGEYPHSLMKFAIVRLYSNTYSEV